MDRDDSEAYSTDYVVTQRNMGCEEVETGAYIRVAKFAAWN